MTGEAGKKSIVRDFWNRNVNQLNQLRRDDIGTPDFFAAAESLRFKYHYHLPPLFDRISQEYPRGRLIEVGCSMGNDTVQLARRGLAVTGVDLTQSAVDLIRQRFSEQKLAGEFHVADAEQLPLDDELFDVAYSFGVLHHTPDTGRAVAEIHRVLKVGGKAYVMLYHKRSLNWLMHRLTGVPFDGSRQDPCPVEKTYTRDDARTLFHKFENVQVTIDYLCGTGWGVFGKMIPTSLHRWLGRRIGWHLMIEGTKMASSS